MTDETKEFASIKDATPTTAIPSETDATTATTTMVTVDDRTDTTVLPSAADDDETAVLPVPTIMRMISLGYDTQATAASPSPIKTNTDRIAQETIADAVEGDGGPVPSADDVPMYAASSARPAYEQSQTAGKPCHLGGAPRTSRMLRMSRMPRTSRNRAPARLLWYSDY